MQSNSKNSIQRLDPIYQLSLKLKTPLAVQKYIYTLQYNKKTELLSALSSIRQKRAHCLEGVFIAAAILEYHYFDPWCLSFESQDGLDHCLFLFQNKKRLWGSIGKSRDRGLFGRPAQFKTIRQLVESYKAPYIDKTGRITAWQVAHLDEVNCDWRRSSRNVWSVETHLLKIKHHKFLSSDTEYTKIKAEYLKMGPIPDQSHWWTPPQ